VTLSSFHSGSEITTLVGKPVASLFSLLVALKREVSELRFESFRGGAGISERVRKILRSRPELERALGEQLLDSIPGLPLWDRIASAMMGNPQIGGLPDDLISAVIKHSPEPASASFVVSSSDIQHDGITKITEQICGEEILAVCSKVKLESGKLCHIPMLDFLCPCSEQNEESLLRMLKEIGERSGVLVNSGRSYHYYGIRLLGRDDWVRFMAKALMFAPYSDPRYIAHRLADGQCRLRVFSRTRPMPMISRVLDYE
jgi:hypothetical protein